MTTPTKEHMAMLSSAYYAQIILMTTLTALNGFRGRK